MAKKKNNVSINALERYCIGGVMTPPNSDVWKSTAVPVHVQHAAGGIGKLFRLCQTVSPRFSDAEHMGRHGEEVSHLLPFHGKIKPDAPGFHQGEAGQLRHGVLFPELKLRINDAFQSQQMILRRQHLKEIPPVLQDPGKFLRQGNGKQAGQKGGAAVLHRDMGRGGAEPAGILIFCGGAAHRFLGNVQSGKGQTQLFRQGGAVVSFAAAHIQNISPDGKGFRLLHQGTGNGSIEARFQKGAPGQHLFPGISGIQGTLVLHRQQMDIALPGNVKAVVLRTDIPVFPPGQYSGAQGANQFHSTSLHFISYPISPGSSNRRYTIPSQITQ